jgi:hypothetical protein
MFVMADLDLASEHRSAAGALLLQRPEDVVRNDRAELHASA